MPLVTGQNVKDEHEFLAPAELDSELVRRRRGVRRVAFAIRVAYGTHDAQLTAIPAMVREIVAAHPVDFEHCHFMSYGDWSLDFKVVCHFRNPDWFAHLDTQQAIYLELYRRFAEHGI